MSTKKTFEDSDNQKSAKEKWVIEEEKKRKWKEKMDNRRRAKKEERPIGTLSPETNCRLERRRDELQ